MNFGIYRFQTITMLILREQVKLGKKKNSQILFEFQTFLRMIKIFKIWFLKSQNSQFENANLTFSNFSKKDVFNQYLVKTLASHDVTCSESK